MKTKDKYDGYSNQSTYVLSTALFDDRINFEFLRKNSKWLLLLNKPQFIWVVKRGVKVSGRINWDDINVSEIKKSIKFYT